MESSKTAYLVGEMVTFRRLMSPAFYSKNLNRMYPIFASAAARLLARWNGELARSTGSVFRIPDMSLELKKVLRKYLLVVAQLLINSVDRHLWT